MFLIALVLLVMWGCIIAIIEYNEATGFEFFSWKWYWYIMLAVGVFFAIALSIVLGRLWLIWISQYMQYRIDKLKNKSTSLPKIVQEAQEELAVIKKMRKGLEI